MVLCKHPRQVFLIAGLSDLLPASCSHEKQAAVRGRKPGNQFKKNLPLATQSATKKKELLMKEFASGKYDIAVIGAGHAGIEAALAAARLGQKTICFTIKSQG